MNRLNEKQIVSMIGSISRRGARLDNDIWQCAYSSLAHAREFSNFSLFQQLLNAMPQGSRVATLISWAKNFSPASVNKTPQGTWKVTGSKQSDRTEWDLEGMVETPWWSFKPPTEQAVFGLEALSKMLAKVAEGKDTPSRAYRPEAMAIAAQLVTLVELAMAEGGQPQPQPQPQPKPKIVRTPKAVAA